MSVFHIRKFWKYQQIDYINELTSVARMAVDSLKAVDAYLWYVSDWVYSAWDDAEVEKAYVMFNSEVSFSDFKSSILRSKDHGQAWLRDEYRPEYHKQIRPKWSKFFRK